MRCLLIRRELHRTTDTREPWSHCGSTRPDLRRSGANGRRGNKPPYRGTGPVTQLCGLFGIANPRPTRRSTQGNRSRQTVDADSDTNAMAALRLTVTPSARRSGGCTKTAARPGPRIHGQCEHPHTATATRPPTSRDRRSTRACCVASRRSRSGRRTPELRRSGAEIPVVHIVPDRFPRINRASPQPARRTLITYRGRPFGTQKSRQTCASGGTGPPADLVNSFRVANDSIHRRRVFDVVIHEHSETVSLFYGAGTEPHRLRPEFRASEVDTEILKRHCCWSGIKISLCWGRLLHRRQAQILQCVERHILERTVRESPGSPIAAPRHRSGRSRRSRESLVRAGLRCSSSRYGSIERLRSGSDSIGNGRFNLSTMAAC